MKSLDEIRKPFFVLFYNIHKENMFTIKIDDGRDGSQGIFACLSVCVQINELKKRNRTGNNFFLDSIKGL